MPERSLLLTLLIIIQCFLVNAQDLDRYWNALDTAKSHKSKSEIYGEMSFECARYDTDSALKYAELGVYHASFVENLACKRIAHFYLANANQFSGKSEDALLNFQKSLQFSRKLNRINAQAADYTSIGGVRFDLSQYDKAIECFQHAIELYKKSKNLETNDSTNLAACFHYLANTYTAIGLYDDALNSNHKAVALYEKLQRKDKVELMRVSRAHIISETTGERAAINMLRKSLVFFESNNDNYNVARIYSNLSPSYRALHMLDSALFCSNFALKIHKNIEYPFGQMYDHMNLGYLYQEKGSFSRALSHFRESHRLALIISNEDQIAELNLEIAETLYALGRYSEAVHFYSQYAVKSKEYNMPELIKKSSQLPFKIKIEEKKREMSELKKEKLQNERFLKQQGRLKDAQLQQQVTLTISIIAISVLLVILLLVLLKKYREKRKSDEEKTVLLAEIHHRVKNNLQLVSSLLNLQSNSQNDPLIKSAIDQGHDRIKAMWLIHQKLYQKEDFSSVKMDDYIETLVSHTKDIYASNDGLLQLEVNVEPINLNIDHATALGLIINELINNAIKHGKLGQLHRVQLNLKKLGESLELVVCDNGPGLPADFDLKQSKSYGLKLVQLLGKEIKGNLNWINQNGLRFTLTFQHIQ